MEFGSIEVRHAFAKASKMMVKEGINLCYRNRGKSFMELYNEYTKMFDKFLKTKSFTDRTSIFIHLYSYLVSMFYITNCTAIKEDEFLFYKKGYAYAVYYDIKNKLLFTKKKKYIDKIHKMFEKENRDFTKETI